MRGIDWSVLKKALIFLIICLFVCSFLVGQSYYFNNNLTQQLRKDNAEALANQTKYLDIDREEKMLHEYYPHFVKFYQNGIIGSERRLDWVDSLKQLGQNMKLPSLSYTISPREEYLPDFQAQYDGYKLYKSSMALNINLLHEGDFFKLLTQLEQTSVGFYSMSQCSFKSGNKIIFEKGSTNIKATCALDWITMELASGKKIEL